MISETCPGGGGGGNGNGNTNPVNGQCYKIKSVQTNQYASLVSNEIHFLSNGSPNQIWQLESAGRGQFNIKTPNSSTSKFHSTGAWGETITLGSGMAWTFHQTGNNYRLATSWGATWDHRGAGGQPQLQIWGSTTDPVEPWRTFALEGVSCPGQGSRRRDIEESALVEEVEMPFLGITPNPAGAEMAVNVYLETAQDLEVSLSSSTGVVLKSIKKEGRKGLNSFAIDLSDLSPGAYLVKANTTTTTETKKLIKQ